MKPLIMYIDDEVHNLTVFEASMPADWEVMTFESPLKALEVINQKNPWVVLSDQRMPGMNGVSFLELVRKISPHAIRAIVTGFSEEDLVIESVRKAHIFDYIRKPWDIDDLNHRLQIMVETYRLERELREKNVELLQRNHELEKLNKEIGTARDREVLLRKELEAWAPPFTLSTLSSDPDFKFPKKSDLAVLTYDIVDSAKLHGFEAYGKPLRGAILQGFTQCIIRHGGWRESSSGDSAYAHFGMVKKLDQPADAAYAAASEFRVFLRNLSQSLGITFECGIGLHFAKDSIVDLHEIKVQAFGQDIIHKSFESASMGIDLVHRMEKLMHELPGTNIVLSKTFVDHMTPKDYFQPTDLGSFLFKGQQDPVQLLLKASDRVQPQDLEKIMQQSVSAKFKKAA